MDLLGTELVVLSASDTGLGEVHVGEGVFGLKRAFALAGAKTVVTSLWKVAGQQTRELMEDFYRHLLQGQTRADALREAQLAMKERYPDPLYWGAFVCQADPGQMLKLHLKKARDGGLGELVSFTFGGTPLVAQRGDMRQLKPEERTLDTLEDGMTAREWLDASGTSETTFFRHRNKLGKDGLVELSATATPTWE